MPLNTKHFYLLTILSLLIFSSGYSQSKQIWTEQSPSGLVLFQKSGRATKVKREKIYTLDISSLKNRIESSFARKNQSSKSSNILIPFPDKNGNLKNYRITETATLSKELQSKYPNIKSYKGISDDGSKTTIRFSMNEREIHCMTNNSNGNIEFIDPYTKDALNYKIYAKSDLDIANKVCRVADEIENISENKTSISLRENSNDGKSRVFRLALSCTGEYSQYHLTEQGVLLSATEAVKKSAVLAAMNTSMTRINGIFEKELALTMQLIGNTDDLIFLNPNTDGYSNDDDIKLIEEVQAKCTSIIGASNYDIGHLFTTGVSGLAELGSPCTDNKAQGVSGRNTAGGDAFDIDFVAHEMGHQFGATHTYNNSCSENRTTATAYEPGSGSTIMGYAGICSPNVQGNSDAYFHSESLKQMYDNIVFGNSTCGDQSNIAETPPIADAGNTVYTIPASTPFVLKGNGTSGTENTTYTWEQIDNGIATMPPLGSNTVGPLFRSIQGTSNNERHFPAIETTVAGEIGTQWEQLPLVTRNLNFRLTLRDNGEPYGQFDTDDILVNVFDTEKPFEVTSQETAETVYVGESESIVWEVAETNNNPINCEFVNIVLSTDGGFTYPTALASNVLNNGSYNVIIPDNPTTQARIKIEAADNIFYNINKANFTIASSNFTMIVAENPLRSCAPDTAMYEFEYNTYLGFTETTTFTVSNLPEGTTGVFSPETATTGGTTVTLTISGITESLEGTYSPILKGTAATDENTVSVELIIDASSETIPYLTFPQNNTNNLSTDFEFLWTTERESNEFIIDIATDIYFDNIAETGSISLKKYTAQNLEEGQAYFWRVRETNACGEGENSLVYKFTTGQTENFNYSNNEQAAIPDNDSNGINSIINIPDAIEISKVTIETNINHEYTGDIQIILKNPQNQTIKLIETNDKQGVNFINTVFDDSAILSILSGDAPYTNSFRPIDALSEFNQTKSLGDWVLHISDNAEEDTGRLLNWEINIEGINQNSLSVIDPAEENNPKVSKAFSPNGDQINDFWTIENINTTNQPDSNFPFANVKIYDIRGQVVYESKNYRNDWNGVSSSGAKLTIGTYIYEVTFSNPKFKTQKGWLFIKY